MLRQALRKIYFYRKSWQRNGLLKEKYLVQGAHLCLWIKAKVTKAWIWHCHDRTRSEATQAASKCANQVSQSSVKARDNPNIITFRWTTITIQVMIPLIAQPPRKVLHSPTASTCVFREFCPKLSLKQPLNRNKLRRPLTKTPLSWIVCWKSWIYIMSSQ